MSQTILIDRPPNFDLIAEAFPHVRTQRGIIYSWGGWIYNPDNAPIAPHLLAHEAVHGERQGMSVFDWWARYCDDERFRLSEEVAAHQAEYRWWLDHGNRAERRRALKQVAARLASPLYGRIISKSEAESILRTQATMGDGDERICF